MRVYVKNNQKKPFAVTTGTCASSARQGICAHSTVMIVNINLKCVFAVCIFPNHWRSRVALFTFQMDENTKTGAKAVVGRGKRMSVSMTACTMTLHTTNSGDMTQCACGSPLVSCGCFLPARRFYQHITSSVTHTHAHILTLLWSETHSRGTLLCVSDLHPEAKSL